MDAVTRAIQEGRWRKSKMINQLISMGVMLLSGKKESEGS